MGTADAPRRANRDRHPCTASPSHEGLVFELCTSGAMISDCHLTPAPAGAHPRRGVSASAL
jgi:hypothetical protein